MAALRAWAGRLLNPRADLSRLRDGGGETPPGPLSARRARARRRAVLGNGPLWIGSIIVLVLFAVVLFGPLFAPQNPYLAGQRIISYNEQGQIIAPPYEPSAEFPLGSDKWGRDILSMLLYGTRNTLVASAFITMARLLLGLGLGALAGWNEGKFSDRLIMGAVSVTTALPTLIAAMIIIFALDIRRGLPVFIVALSLVGWAEIAQYIRSEFIVLRQRPFIEGAHASGLPGLDIAVRHVLPNVLPQLIIITLLEMGAVLMLLGELGFVQVYIGGGIQSTNAADQAITIPDIPEWGAMMADSRAYARAKPWMVIYPAAAFFLAVVGFNALGEGLRRLIEQVAVNTNVLLSRRMLLFIAALTLATVYIIQNVGPAPSYARLASEFDGQAALAHVRALTALEGRGNGQPGGRAAAEYIAARFKEYGLAPAGRAGTYFHPFPTRLVQPLAQPGLSLLDGEGRTIASFRHQLDFGFVIEGHGGSGQARAPLAFVALQPGRSRFDWEEFVGLDVRGRVVLLLADNAPADFTTELMIRGAEGVLWVVADEQQAVRSQIQLADPERDYVRAPTLPVFRIRPPVAADLLESAGLALADLRASLDDWPASEGAWRLRLLDSTVHMAVELSPPEDVELLNVLGRLSGKDIVLDDQLVAVTAHYDTLGRDPGGAVFPGANDNASGVATLLEIARLWHERELAPRRTMVFAAWSGANLDLSGAAAYVAAPSPSLTPLTLVALVQLDNLGAGEDALLLDKDDGRVSALLAESAAQVGQALEVEPRFYHVYQELLGADPTSLLVSRVDSALPVESDTLEHIDPGRLAAAGEVLNLTLINLSREPNF